MRKLLITLGLLLILLIKPCVADTLLDSFSGGDGSLGGNWNGGYGAGRDCQVVSGVVEGTTLNSACWQTWAVNSFSGDQTAIFKIVAIGNNGTGAPSLLLRASATAFTAYRVVLNPNSDDRILVRRTVNGTSTDLDTEGTVTWAVDDEVKATVTGTDPVTITVYQNGVSVFSVNDGTGEGSFLTPLGDNLIGLSCSPSGDVANCQIDDFKTADITPPAATAGNIMVITVE